MSRGEPQQTCAGRSEPRLLERLDWAKRKSAPSFSIPLGDELLDYFQGTLRQRQSRFSAIAPRWMALVPPLLSDHCTLHSLHRGTLTVLVDSTVHMYELRQLLLAGLQQQLLLACKSAGVRKIVLRPGRPEEEEARFRRRS